MDIGTLPTMVDHNYESFKKPMRTDKRLPRSAQYAPAAKRGEKQTSQAGGVFRRAAEVPVGNCFVDAARYGNSNRYTVVPADQAVSVIYAASTECSSSSAAEEVAIIIAFVDEKRANVVCYSRAAISAFAVAAIFKELRRIFGDKGRSAPERRANSNLSIIG
ncbi:hypothetical protein HPB52_022822 [Rhipicephalus sanguineus]|uniref:Uncharacterized protein n=1 Tax=Rhipicephalus sanguineus TaxID=34632 RepID=A0A9D4SR67_RHISA|nr:hypothetical protein HPB52_022822 [Rhipicephalus sanguineus]